MVNLSSRLLGMATTQPLPMGANGHVFTKGVGARLDLSPGISYFLGQLGKAFLDPGSHVSLLSLAGAFLIAFAFLSFRRLRKGRRVRVMALLRALFPRHIVSSKSNVADLSYFYFNIFVFGLVFG
jgi:hypothetical protein